MTDDEHILISLEPRHAESILTGKKRVELRRRTMCVLPGTTLWIYAKVPVGSIVGRARIGEVDASSPAVLWRRHGSISGLSKREFFSYFEGANKGVALILGKTKRLRDSLSLRELRELDGGFQPPQFFSRLSAAHPLRTAVVLAAR